VACRLFDGHAALMLLMETGRIFHSSWCGHDGRRNRVDMMKPARMIYVMKGNLARLGPGCGTRLIQAELRRERKRRRRNWLPPRPNCGALFARYDQMWSFHLLI